MDRAKLKTDFLHHNKIKYNQSIALRKDASYRQYERLIQNDGSSFILMDAPPEKEKVEPFIHVANLLLKNHLSAPKIIHSDIKNGFLLLEDFGDSSFTNILAGKTELNNLTEMEIYEQAVDALIHLHKSSHEASNLDPYNEAMLIQESTRFITHYLPVSNGRRISKTDQDEFIIILKHLLRSAKTSVPINVITLRDYHADNLMWLNNRDGINKVGMLDFQDAVIGSPVYDLVSLLEDARRDVNFEVVEKMIDRYLKSFPHYSRKHFAAAYAILGIQRNLKIVGIFARQASVYRNSHYLTYLPRVWRHINHNLKHPLLLPLKQWLLKIIPSQIRD